MILLGKQYFHRGGDLTCLLLLCTRDTLVVILQSHDVINKRAPVGEFRRSATIPRGVLLDAKNSVSLAMMIVYPYYQEISGL